MRGKMTDSPSVQADGVPIQIDVERLAQNVGQMVEAAGRVASAIGKPVVDAKQSIATAESLADVARTLGRAAQYWVSDPTKLAEAQVNWAEPMINLWSNTAQRFLMLETQPLIPADPADKRFADPTWTNNPFFDFMRQAHAISTRWANDLVSRNEALDPHAKAKTAFFVRQISSALSPSNFLPTNPDLLRTTISSEGSNLARGLTLLAEDFEAGQGQLRLRQSDNSRLELGRDMAATPGKVVFRNELIELIQYQPATDTVFARPLLVVPPWINKFYILDLNEKKSFVKWLVEQGLTVFMISWLNPDERQADVGFDAYMHDGIRAALGAIERATGERDVTAMGYCVGGTLLSATLAWMAAKGDTRISSATLFATQVDFTNPGELSVFTDEESIAAVEAMMAEKGYLDGAVMAGAFNMLRPDDLIWSYVINNYMKGRAPLAFDLLTWNSDSTRMTRACHSYYLRQCYLENNLSHGRMELDGVMLDLGKITVPVYSLATKEDHISPAPSVFRGMQFFGGPVRYVLGGSGHIAGVINPPAMQKYQYWTDGAPEGTFDEWAARATETQGSWWPDWVAWIEAQAPRKVPARHPGDRALAILGDAPGDYVRVKS
jgi:polyhydroxyalkanoate synthase